MRELDSRTTDGIRVRLLWSERDERLVVAVSDARAHEDFVVEVRSGERPVDVFHHPYAYAAWHAISTCASSPPVATLVTA